MDGGNQVHIAPHIAYASEDGTVARIVHIFPDIEAMKKNMQKLGGLGIKAFTLMEIVGINVYGMPLRDSSGFDGEDDSGNKVDYETSACGRTYPFRIRLNRSKWQYRKAHPYCRLTKRGPYRRDTARLMDIFSRLGFFPHLHLKKIPPASR